MQFLMDPHQQQHPPPPSQSQAQPQTQPQPPPPVVQLQLPLVTQPTPLQQQPPAAGTPATSLPQIPQFSQVANPTPNLVSVPVSNNHPPYAQMITEAIAALKEKDGSSKRAIAKYIERVYSNSNLSATHSALLTYNLKRLKDQGNIVMVKHSYKLPNARSPAVGPSPPPNQTSNGPKRGPGRPPKAKNAVTAPPPPSPTVQARHVDQGAPVPAQISAPATSAPVTIPPGPNTDPVSIFASLGLVDGPVPVPVPVSAPTGPVAKRRPGRPKKTHAGGTPGALQPNPTLGKKVPGRPRKVAAKNAVNAALSFAGLAGSVVVSPRGQPRLKADGTPAKPRGRPPKKNVSVPSTNNVGVPVPASGFLAPAVYVGEGALATAPAPGTKRRGRPPSKAQNGPKMPRKLSGKPLGRPKKISSATATQGPTMQQLLAYNEVKNKLDFFQTRIKQTVSVLKPCLDSTSAAGALSALRELEELANLEIGPPATVPVQQPPPQNDL